MTTIWSVDEPVPVPVPVEPVPAPPVPPAPPAPAPPVPPVLPDPAELPVEPELPDTCWPTVRLTAATVPDTGRFRLCCWAGSMVPDEVNAWRSVVVAAVATPVAGVAAGRVAAQAPTPPPTTTTTTAAVTITRRLVNRTLSNRSLS